MVACERQLLGLALAIIGFLGTVSICFLSNWTLQILFYEPNNVLSQGLWKVCGTFPEQIVACKQYGEPLSIYISLDLEVARALIIIAIIIGVLGIFLGVVGSKFINFVPDEMEKSKMTMVSGVTILIAGLFVLIPVCWTTITINNRMQGDRGKSEPGASLYFGWITTALLFLGGGLLCSSFLCREETNQDVEYANPHPL